MKARLKVGTSEGRLTIELPDDFALGLGLRAGDEVDVEIDRVAQQLASGQDSLASLRKYRGRMPAGFKFDRDEANRR